MTAPRGSLEKNSMNEPLATARLEVVSRPDVEFFIAATSKPYFAWGMADVDVLSLCKYILMLEAKCNIVASFPITDPTNQDAANMALIARLNQASETSGSKT